MVEFLSRILDTGGFPPRWTCGQWTPVHGWLHVISDVAIFWAYVSIPAILVYLVVRRSDLPFPRIFWLFCGFIFTCGTAHLVDATLFWYPWYRLSGVLKFVTAIASWLTVFALAPAARRALELPGLAAINERLRQEIAARQQAETQLVSNAEALKNDNDVLESFSRAVVDREYRVIELKGEVNALLVELGRDPRYAVAATA